MAILILSCIIVYQCCVVKEMKKEKEDRRMLLKDAEAMNLDTMVHATSRDIHPVAIESESVVNPGDVRIAADVVRASEPAVISVTNGQVTSNQNGHVTDLSTEEAGDIFIKDITGRDTYRLFAPRLQHIDPNKDYSIKRPTVDTMTTFAV